MQGKPICSEHQWEAKQLCANMYCQEEERFVCEKCDDKKHKICKDKQMLKSMEWFQKYAQDQSLIAESIFAYQQKYGQFYRLLEQNQEEIKLQAQLWCEYTQKLEHFQKFGSALKWNQIIFDKNFQQQQLLLQELPDEKILQKSIKILQRFNQQWEQCLKLKFPSVDLDQKKQGKLNQTMITKQKSKLSNIIQQQVNSSDGNSQQFEIGNLASKEIASTLDQVKLEPEKSYEIEINSREQNLDQTSFNKSASEFHLERQGDNASQDKIGDSSTKKEILKSDFEIRITKEIEFLTILQDGKILIQEKQKIHFYEETGEKGMPLKCIRKREFDSRILWVSIQGLSIIILTRDRKVHLLDFMKIIAQDTIKNIKQHQVAFSESNQKFFQFDSSDNNLVRYSLKNQKFEIEQKKENSGNGHVMAIQVLSNSLYIGFQSGTVEKLDLLTFENQFTYHQTPKIRMKQFAVSDNHIFLMKDTDIILKNHKNEVIKNLEKLQPIYQMGFRYTDDSLIIVYSRKEQIEKLQFINLDRSGNVQTMEFYLKNYITSYALQPNSNVPSLYCVIQRKIRKYQINC